jgi:prevent-host-death family protein
VTSRVDDAAVALAPQATLWNSEGKDSGKNATICYMEHVPSRDLRNHTADVLRKVAAGGEVAVTVHGAVVAEIVPPRDTRLPYVRRSELAQLLRVRTADAGLADDLAVLAGDTTDDLGPPS